MDNTSADSPASSPPSAAHDSDATTSAIVLSPIGQLVESDRLKRKRSESVATSVATGLKEEDASDDEEGEEERESSAAETSGPSALAMAAVFEDERGFKLVDIVGVEILLDHLLSWPLRKKGAKVVGLIDPSLKRRLDSCPEVIPSLIIFGLVMLTARFPALKGRISSSIGTLFRSDPSSIY